MAPGSLLTISEAAPGSTLNGAAPDQRRWLLSYADFITLLCAFFIMLYAIGEADRRNGTNLLKEVQQRLMTSPASQAASQSSVESASSAGTEAELPADPVKAAKAEETSDESSGYQSSGAFHQRLQNLAQLFPETADIRFMDGNGWIAISVAGEFLFDEDEYLLSPAAESAVGKLAAEIRRWPYAIEVYGRSRLQESGVGMSGSDSGWHLSAMRAASVVQSLVASGVAPVNIEATGLAHYQRRDRQQTGWQPDNDAEPRVDVVLLRNPETVPWSSGSSLPESDTEQPPR